MRLCRRLNVAAALVNAFLAAWNLHAGHWWWWFSALSAALCTLAAVFVTYKMADPYYHEEP